METIGYPLGTIAIFIAITFGLFVLDLRSHKEAHEVSLKNATMWSVFYIAAALGFAGYLGFQYGSDKASLFITGYTLEKVLSVDNLLVFTAIFTYFGIKPEYHHKLLHYGIIGAIVFRLIFVVIGVGSLNAFGPVVEMIFAILVAYSAWGLWRSFNDDADDDIDHESRWYIKWTKKLVPVTGEEHNGRFFIGGAATTMFLALITVEVSDIMFAFDSVPAIIAVTRDPLIVYTAMIFAILGLRSLYFVLNALIKHLTHLDKAVCVVLVFIAAKLALHASIGFKFDPNHSLFIVLGILGLGVVASYIWPDKETA